MNYWEVVRKFAEIMDMEDDTAKDCINCLTTIIEDGILRDGKCVVNDFGTFTARERKAGVVYDFHRKKCMPIAPRRVMHFKPGKRFQKKIRGDDWVVNEEVRQAALDAEIATQKAATEARLKELQEEYSKNRIKYIHFGVSFEDFLREKGMGEWGKRTSENKSPYIEIYPNN